MRYGGWQNVSMGAKELLLEYLFFRSGRRWVNVSGRITRYCWSPLYWKYDTEIWTDLRSQILNLHTPAKFSKQNKATYLPLICQSMFGRLTGEPKTFLCFLSTIWVSVELDHKVWLRTDYFEGGGVRNTRFLKGKSLVEACLSGAPRVSHIG